MSRRKLLRILFACLATAASHRGLAQNASPVLSNGIVTATFDDAGLSSIGFTATGKLPHRFRDGWSIVIDSTTLRSRDFSAERLWGTDRITYRYAVPGGRVEAVYELKPGVAFISKRLRVLRDAAEYTVHQVAPITLALTQPPSATRVPESYTPQLGVSLAQSQRESRGHDYGVFLRREAQKDGLMVLAQNPFLEVEQQLQRVALQYRPEMKWEQAWGDFEADIVCVGPYDATGEVLPREMPLEWRLEAGRQAPDGLDRGEIEAFRQCVRAFLEFVPEKPLRVETAWTLNDYQADLATGAGRAEYDRILDATAGLHIPYLIYSGTNTGLALRQDDTDDWHWEHTLWLNLGQRIRKGAWDPATDPIPQGVQDLVAHAKARGVGLLAYVYPSLTFAVGRVTAGASGGRPRASSLASRDFQNLLLGDLIAFKRRTGIAGYSFDYAFFNLPGSSSYAQWAGWRRVMSELRRAEPGIVLDGRQSYQLFGPWSWLTGNYPHPLGQDEQPESFIPFPDLHFDRVSADRARYVNFWYRNYQFTPAELVPGYATHQTERSRNIPDDVVTGGKPQSVEEVHSEFRARDWDYLGFRYSFLSSIATGGWNNIINMIPAKDPEEARNFSAADKQWIRDWLDWTDAHKDLLRNTRTILHAPQIGQADGTSAIADDHGYVFLFNPNYKMVSDSVRLDESLGLHTADGEQFLLRELYPQRGRLWAKPGEGVWRKGDRVALSLDGSSATVLELTPFNGVTSDLVFNSARTASVKHRGGSVALQNIEGEAGATTEIGVLLKDASRIRRFTINGVAAAFHQNGAYLSAQASFAGSRFAQAQQITLYRSSDGAFSGSFTVPKRVKTQLAARAKSWPLPWTADDLRTTWLAPQRLLLFVQAAEADNRMSATLTIDGRPVTLLHAYTSVRVHPAAFVGLYCDLSAIAPDMPHSLELKLGRDGAGVFQGVFFENVQPQFTSRFTVR